MKKYKVEIEIWGVTLEITFDYYPYVPATYENPEEGGEVDILEITHMGVSVYNLVAEIKDFEEKILQKLKEKRDEN